MFDPLKRPTIDQLITNPIFKSFTDKKNENKEEESELIEELDTEESEESLFEQTELKIKELKKEIKEEKKKENEEEKEETYMEDPYNLVRSDLIMFLYNVLKAYSGLQCMVHIVRVMDKYVELLRKNKDAQFTLNELFKDKTTSKLIVMAITILMTSLLVQWRDLFTINQLEDLLDIDSPDEIITRISDVLTVMNYNLYERTFDSYIISNGEKMNYEKLREVLKNEKFFTLTIEEQKKLYSS